MAPYTPLPATRVTAPTWMGPGMFDHFHHDHTMFGHLDYDLPPFPAPLPDSPPSHPGFYSGPRSENPKYPGYYTGPWTSRRIVGANSEMEGQEAGGSGTCGGAPPGLTTEERLVQAHDQIAQMCTEYNQLQAELDQARQPAPDRGRPGRPPYRPDPDNFSIPRPPGYAPPEQGSIGSWNKDSSPPFLGVKPIIVKVPSPFVGAHNDIQRFLGDCTTYFEVLRHYFQGIPSLMVVFASSHFEGNAQNWWTHHQETYWSNDDNDPEPPHY